MRYTKYSAWLKNKYGGKVYKLPINLPCTCPNRDGLLSRGGCIFCGEVGTGFEANRASFDVEKQLAQSMARIAPKYKPDYYIAYFQNYTNTYLPLNTFRSLVESACATGVVGLSISTRPDCIGEPYLKVLDAVQAQYGVDIEVELGLQSANDETLKIINRGHDVAAFVDAVKRVHAHGFTVCAHLIGNLPWDTEADNLAAIELIKSLAVEGVKIHSLYILKHTVLGDMYQRGAIELIDYNAYLERLIKMVRHLPENVVIQRLFGRAPEEDTLFCNWQMSWRKLQNEFEARLEALDVRQGDLC
ncbi:TIGR01212 family radical SAM protein [Fusibacter paucivorans]|uniref:TIGR01212 family radical SAM protein n=1 Tax=Fusibacter paucivorans TaxID=76009 RepID=A0ABS5PM53_9FIRM|nr:TIGR01212 family radical SAM protein [Fusibacter paucivorans]MBS7525484.1 TIGR01212 family radical SAM protein [Fusibacter paucivorans]